MCIRDSYYVVTAVDDSGNESSVSSEVQICPHPDVENGTVSDTDCSITCNDGYTLDESTHTCVASGGGGAAFIPPSTTEEESTQEEEQAAEEGEEVEEVSEEEVGEETPSEEKPISEMTVEELQAKILEIQQLIAQLQQQLQELLGEEGGTTGGTIEGIPEGFTFDRNLKMGMTGDDVKYLQILLNSDPDTKLADSGAGSPGNETTYFGPRTKAAVIKFQEKYADDVLAPWDLTEGTGYVGKTTRQKLNQLLASR